MTAELARVISVRNPAIIGHVTLADVEGRPGGWRWVLASYARPLGQLPEQDRYAGHLNP